MAQTAPSDTSSFITLKGGLVASIEALDLLWNLEARDFAIEAVEGERIRITPPDRLTAEDVAAIRRLKPELLALVRHCDSAPAVM